jgi:hypothetical protein
MVSKTAEAVRASSERIPFKGSYPCSLLSATSAFLTGNGHKGWSSLTILPEHPRPSISKFRQAARVLFDFALKRATWRTVRSARPNARVPVPSRGRIDLEGAWGPPHAHVHEDYSTLGYRALSEALNEFVLHIVNRRDR